MMSSVEFLYNTCDIKSLPKTFHKAMVMMLVTWVLLARCGRVSSLGYISRQVSLNLVAWVFFMSCHALQRTGIVSKESK